MEHCQWSVPRLIYSICSACRPLVLLLLLLYCFCLLLYLVMKKKSIRPRGATKKYERYPCVYVDLCCLLLGGEVVVQAYSANNLEEYHLNFSVSISYYHIFSHHSHWNGGFSKNVCCFFFVLGFEP